PRPAPAQPRAAPPPPAPKPSKPAGDQPVKTLWFPSGKGDEGTPAKLDELAFLRSVTEDDRPAPSKRTSGSSSRPVETVTPIPEPAAATPVEPPAPPARSPAEYPELLLEPTVEARPESEPPIVEHGAAEPAAPAPEPRKDKPTTNAKTLKCGECGALNRPTEWYCDQCGAELAAL
ncbi:MAG TPA: hypothetical protein VNK43_05885, partial [Gemmatimonadales bacterium]|nr:hypothetical protein [Gemmatimonadales bacterium]